MLPTIDLSNLAVVGLCITVLKKVAEAFIFATKFVIQKLLLFIAASRIWANVFFLGLAITLCTILNTALERLISFVIDKQVDKIDWGNIGFEFAVIEQVIDIPALSGLLAYGIALVIEYYVATKYLHAASQAILRFRLFAMSWKI